MDHTVASHFLQQSVSLSADVTDVTMSLVCLQSVSLSADVTDVTMSLVCLPPSVHSADSDFFAASSLVRESAD